MKLLLLIIFSGALNAFSQQTAGTAADLKSANQELSLLKAEKGNTVPLLSRAAQDLDTYKATVVAPHNIDAANQRAAMAAAEAAPYDPYDAGSVAAHNAAIGQAGEWGKRVEERRMREEPNYEALQQKKAEYEQALADLDAKIQAIIHRFNPNCDANSSEEALANCWAMFYDGELKRKSLGDDPVYPGTNFFSSGVPIVSSDAFKNYRNRQLDDINRGINKTYVPPPPPPPPPPPKGAIEKATDDTIDFIKDLIYGKPKYKARRTTAVLAVRG